MMFCRGPMPAFGGEESRSESSPGEFHPEALAEPDVSVSAHPAPIIRPRKRHKDPSTGLILPAGSSPVGLTNGQDRMTQPLRSTGITPLHHYYELLCPSAPHRYAHSCGTTHLNFSHNISTTGSHVPLKEPETVSRHLYTGHHPASQQAPAGFFPDHATKPGFDAISCCFRCFIGGSLTLVSLFLT